MVCGGAQVPDARDLVPVPQAKEALPGVDGGSASEYHEQYAGAGWPEAVPRRCSAAFKARRVAFFSPWAACARARRSCSSERAVGCSVPRERLWFGLGYGDRPDEAATVSNRLLDDLAADIDLAERWNAAHGLTALLNENHRQDAELSRAALLARPDQSTGKAWTP
jgi:hypothetical protein